MFEFFGEEVWQYLIILGAVAALLGLKAFTLRTKYNTQLDQFVHPSVFM
jgi:hypothetical protein